MIPLHSIDQLYEWCTIIQIIHWDGIYDIKRKTFKVKNFRTHICWYNDCTYEFIIIDTVWWVMLDTHPKYAKYQSLFIKLPRYKRLLNYFSNIERIQLPWKPL